MQTITIQLDDEDFRDVNAAIAKWQACARYNDGRGVIVPEGRSDMRGAILAVICRGWLDSVEEPSE